jgi:hypothetical protein
MNSITEQETISRIALRRKREQTVAGDCPGGSIGSRNRGRDTYGSVLRCGPWNGG